MTKIQPLLTWRGALCESKLPATARHVALTLSLYMSERGDSAYPGAIRLANDTSLSERCVREQLALLVRHGWLTLIEKGGARGDKRHANVYAAVVPPPELAFDGGTTITPEPGSPVTETASTPASDDTRPLHQVQAISSVELSKNSLTVPQRVNAALTELAERDARTIGGQRNKRAVYATCRRTRVSDSKDDLTHLAKQHLDWSSEALANAVDLRDEQTKVELPDCEPCGNTRWSDPDAGPLIRCESCWPLIMAGRKAS